MLSRRLISLGSALALSLALPLALGGCRGEPSKVAQQDDGLTSNDPAVKGALEDQIMVDPALAGRSNRTAASAGNRPVEGGVPSARGGGSPAEAAAAVRGSIGQLMRTPAPGRFEDTCTSNCDRAAARPATLGGLARQQAGEGCANDIQYGLAWVQRLPAAFPLYPRAEVKEAAGIANTRCNIRIVNFQSRAGMQAVLDYYYTMARRNGYDAEHLLRGDDHYLGGTKGDLAYVVMVRQLPGGVVDVDLVASGGR